MFHYFGTCTNQRGDSLGDWQVEVVNVSDGATVNIYSDEISSPIIGNRAITDTGGNFDFFVPEGTYSLKFYDAGGEYQRTQRYLLMYGNAPQAAIDAMVAAQLAQAQTESARDEALNYGGLDIYRTWAALNAVTSQPAGYTAMVVSTDTGTHTDPVVGGTVANSGVFQYSTSPAGFERIADLQGDIARGYAEDAANSVGAVLQLGEFGVQPDGGVVSGAWYVKPFLPTNTGYTLLRHWVIGSGTCDVQVNINDVTAYGPYPATTTKDSDAVNITASVGDSVAIQLNNVTGTPTAVFVQLEGLPA